MIINKKWIGYLNYLKQYIIFIIGGAIGLLISMIVTYILTEFFNIFYMLSYAVSMIFTFFIMFMYHSYITFKGFKYNHKRFIKFVVISIILVFANWGLVYIVTELFKIHYLISIFLVTLFLSIINYTLNKLFIFNIKNENLRI